MSVKKSKTFLIYFLIVILNANVPNNTHTNPMTEYTGRILKIEMNDYILRREIITPRNRSLPQIYRQ